MSHFTVLVCVPATLVVEHGSVEAAVEKMLAPFQENNMSDCPEEYLVFNEDDDCREDPKTGRRGYWENPNAKWDWYQIGGRWTGFLPVTEGTGIRGEPSWASKPNADPRRADMCQVSDLDLSGIGAAMLARAKTFWEHWTYLKTRRERHPEDDFFHGSRGVALNLGLVTCKPTRELTPEEQGHAVPWSAFKDYRDAPNSDVFHDEGLTFEDFFAKHGEYFNPIRTYAVLTEKGWHAKGEMGWFGVDDSTPEATNDYAKNFMRFIVDAPRDMWLAVVDCHI